MNEWLDRLEAGIVTAYANDDLESAQSLARYAAHLERQSEGPERSRAMAVAQKAQEAVSLIQAGVVVRSLRRLDL